ncbi:MAG: hypothetical protein VKI63_06565 [Cyanobium sp.]|nr:hypothetical protein [Cyanobium sp.]
MQNEGPGNGPADPTHLNQLSEAVAADTGIPAGRVRKVLLSARRHASSLEAAPPLPQRAAQPAADAPRDDRLRWYPLGANGGLRPPAPPEPAP